MSSETPHKKAKTSDDTRKDSGKQTASTSGQHDLKISMLEQRIHELQSITYDSVNKLHEVIQNSSGAPSLITSIYTDPLINYEIAIMRSKEEFL